MLADIASLQGRDGEQDWDASARGGLRTDDNGQQREVAERAVRQKARNFFEGKVVNPGPRNIDILSSYDC